MKDRDGLRDGLDGLDVYLRRCRGRLAWLARLRTLLLGTSCVFIAGSAFTVLSAYRVPTEHLVVAARLLLYAGLAAALVAAVLHRPGLGRAVAVLERRVPDYAGRFITWFDARRRQPQPALLPQLAAEVVETAQRHPPRHAVPGRLFAAPALLALAPLALLVWTLAGAPDSVGLAAQRLWLGDMLADTRPTLLVEPGNALVPRGEDVLVQVRGRGFAVRAPKLHARFGGGDWEAADMLPATPGPALDGGEATRHEFVLVAVTQAVDYYLSDGPVASARYRIEVADLPVVEQIAAELDFPSWTGLPKRRQQHGDVAGVVGTRVRIEATADAPLTDAHLVVGGHATPLDEDGAGEFVIESAGRWHVAVSHRGRTVRASGEFLIDVVDDAPPEVRFEFPGRDTAATPIEEVALRFRATDDFAVEALTLHVAVNGGDFATLAGDAAPAGREAKRSHTLYLEDFRVPAWADAGALPADAEASRSLAPGDVVSLYAEARDRGQSVRSELYFVDVRPFHKRYRQRSGGGGGGGGGGSLELSARQRDIVGSVWNLRRERDLGARTGAELRDQIDLVADLQRTLKDQVQTLAARAAGRRLTEDDQVEPFVAELERAALAMTDAEQRLAVHDLDSAVAPAQRALGHLLAGEASLRDVDVTLDSESGDAAGRSLAELVELELDTERNRYETPQSPRGEAAQEESAEWRRLRELARRHEELARRIEEQPAETPLSRWQLESLRRELDTLREQLLAAQQTGGRADRRGASGATPTRTEQSGAESRPDDRPGRSGAIAELDRARAAVDLALERPAGRADALREGARGLRAAADRARGEGAAEVADQVRGAERRAAQLVREQQNIVTRLAERQQRMGEAGRAGRASDWLQPMLAEAETKRRMQRELAAISRDLAAARGRLDDLPGNSDRVGRHLDRALAEIAESRIAERLALAAEYFDAGWMRGVFIGQESRLAATLETLRGHIDAAAERVEQAAGAAGTTLGIDDVQSLRERLQQAGPGADLDTLGDIAAAAERLAAAFDERLDAADRAALRELRQAARESARGYSGRGASAANRERLYRMGLAQLDRLEIALGRAWTTGVGAQQPRSADYDSAEVARYFRRLSCGSEDC